MCYLFVLLVLNMQCPTSLILSTLNKMWGDWWTCIFIKYMKCASMFYNKKNKMMYCFKPINVIFLLHLSTNIVQTLYIVHTLFTHLTASEKPHPYTGSFTTSFLMSGNRNTLETQSLNWKPKVMTTNGSDAMLLLWINKNP